MKYLLDTCVISELIKPKPDKKVVAWISNCDEESLYLSVITIGEIQKGIIKVQDKTRRNAIQQWLDQDLRKRFAGRLLPIDEHVALAWGLVQDEAETAGKPIPTLDGLLGATALAHNLTVVTRNEKDFTQSDARIFNPWTSD